jgi:hypothetical protein
MEQEAFKWIDEAYDAHDPAFLYLKIDSCLHSLRSDPRFDNLTHRAGLSKWHPDPESADLAVVSVFPEGIASPLLSAVREIAYLPL